MWLARDKNGCLNLFSKKPVKCLADWRYWEGCEQGKEYNGRCTCYTFIPEDVLNFPQIKWEDEEPTKINIFI